MRPNTEPISVPRYILEHILHCYWADPEIEADVQTMRDLAALVGFDPEGRGAEIDE